MSKGTISPQSPDGGEALDRLPMALVMVDAAQRVAFVNQPYLDLFPSAAAIPDLIGRPATDLLEIIAPCLVDAAAAQTGILAAAANAVDHYGRRFYTKSGYVLERDAVRLPDGGWVVTYLDITPNMRLQAELRAAAQIPEQNPNPVIRLGPDGQTLYANPAAVALRDLLGESEVAIQRLQLSYLAQAALALNRTQQIEMPMGERYYQVYVVAFPQEHYVNLYLTDITDRRAAERGRELAVTELQNTLRILEDAPHPVLRLGNDGQILYTNAAGNALVTARSQAVPEDLDNSRERMLALMKAVMADGQEQQLEMASGRNYFQVRAIPVPESGHVNVYMTDITARREAEAAVERQRAFYEAVLDHLPGDVTVLTRDLRLRYLNPAAYPDPEVRQWVIGRHYDELATRIGITAERGAQRHQVAEEALRTAQRIVWEEEAITPDGKRRILRRHLQPVLHRGHEQPDLLIAYGIDITAVREAEEAIEKQRAFYEAVLDHLPGDVVVMTRDLHYRYLNPAAQPDPALRRWVVGRSYDEFAAYAGVPAERVAFRHKMMRQALETEQLVAWEEPVASVNGTLRIMQRHFQPVLNRSQGLPDLLIGYGLDITAIRRAQEVLERSEKRYRDLMRYSQALICTHTLDGIVLSVNPAIMELLGVPEQQLVGHPLANAMPPEDRAGVADYLAQFAKPDATASGVMRLQAAHGGGVRYLLYHNVRVDETDGAPYVIGYAQDITERIRAERAARRAREEAEAAAQARANFLANMSHEIRTPLNGILGLANLLAKAGLAEEQQQWVELIGTAGRTLLHLLNDVLDMSKISSGRMDLLEVPFDLGSTIRHVVQPIALRAAEKGVELRVVELPVRSVGVIGDPHRLTQILNNLLTNALKFTPQGYIKLEKRLVSLTDAAITFTILVEDTGIGIAPEVQETIFEEFTQAYSDIASRFGGTGLGLAISARLVNQMGGQLVLSSEHGKGTTFGFTITLPRVDLPSRLNQQPATVDAPQLRGRRILLVEDNEVNRMLARLVLVGQGIVVTEAVDGREAVDIVTQQAPFDLILMDIQMPRLNGVQATAAIRALPDSSRAHVPIVALTANAFRSDIMQYLDAGMDDSLTKPFEEAELVRVLTRLLGTGPVTTTPTPPAESSSAIVEAVETHDFLKAALRITNGNHAAVRQLISTTLVNTPPLLAELVDDKTTASRVAAVAHQLLPIARFFGIDELADMFQTLEVLPADHPDWADYRQYAAQLLDDLVRELAAWQATQG